MSLVRVKAGGRLICNEQSWIGKQRTTHRQSPLLASRHAAVRGITDTRVLNAFEPQVSQ